jgi:hypothetical protein
MGCKNPPLFGQHFDAKKSAPFSIVLAVFSQKPLSSVYVAAQRNESPGGVYPDNHFVIMNFEHHAWDTFWSVDAGKPCSLHSRYQ